MGHSARVEILFTPNAPSVTVIFELLVASGWRFMCADVSTIAYYALEQGSGPTYEYTFAGLPAWPQVRAEMEEKERRQELIGLCLEQDGTEVHCSFDPAERELVAAINTADRKLLDTCGRYTDFNWYVTALVCPLHEQVNGIWAVRCFDQP